MRKVFLWLHLSAGVIAGLVIFIMSVTGVLLTYEKQMIAWFDQRNLPAIGTAPRLPVETLLEKARESRGKLPTAITMQSAPAAPAQLAYGREVLYLDPTTGSLLGAGNLQMRAFFRGVTDWHRWLAASEESRPAARAVTGYANLAFLFIVLSGAYLWLPRVWSKASVRAITLFRGGLSGKARDFNWHNVIGVWCVLPLVFIVAGATVISFPWASNLVYTMMGSPVPAAPSETKAGAGKKERKKSETKQAPAIPAPPDGLVLAGMNTTWDKAASEIPNWRTISMRLPVSETGPVTFQIDEGYAGQPQKRLTIAYDRETAEVKSRESFAGLNAGRQARTWLRFVHTGEFYGLPGQTIAGIASAGAAVLAFTGIALSIRRFAAWRSRRSRAQEAISDLVA